MNLTNRLAETKKLIESGFLAGPTSFTVASIRKLKEVCNGCGAADSWFDYVPDRIIGSYIGHACFIHDWMYSVGITDEDKKEADEAFKANLLKIIKIKTTSVFIITVKYMAAYTYYFGVKRFGSKAYWKGKSH